MESIKNPFMQDCSRRLLLVQLAGRGLLVNIGDMEIFLHICCGPCALYPLCVLKKKGINATGFFCNPNIHPFREYERRVAALEEVARLKDLPIVWDESGYGLKEWLSNLDGVTAQKERCPLCYEMRLERSAREASRKGFKYFSTTLLYSKYQRHGLIREIGEEKAKKYGVGFYYEDFRKGWIDGIEEAVALGIYRQPYCGCIFSESERYAKRIERLSKRLMKKEVLGHESNA